MVTLILKKRLFFIIILGLAGLTFLFLGLSGGLGIKTPSLPGAQVSTENSGSVNTSSVRIEESGMSPVLEKISDIPGVDTEPVQKQDFFIDYRLERDRTRGQQVEWLREVINNTGTADETRQKAQEHLMAISNSIEKESALENLIRAKGFVDAAVILDESTATAIVASASLDINEVAEITELVSRSTGIEKQRIAVINKN